MPRILVVEDDPSIGRALSNALTAEAHYVRWAQDGRAAQAAAAETEPELVLLDLGLPDVDGVELCGSLRAALPDATIIILTARSDEIDIVVGLDAGADDYLLKPFRLGELMARVRAHLRRSTTQTTAPAVTIGDLKVDSAARRAWIAERELNLRAKEFDLLAALAVQAGRVVTREQLMAEVWDENWFGSTKTLDMHISALRRKLDRATTNASRITTLRGVGYRLEQP